MPFRPKEEFHLMLRRIKRTNYDDQDFYAQRDIVDWMEAVENDNNASNAALLLTSVYGFDSFVPVREEDLEGALVVFAFLIHMNCGDLIYIFMSYFQDDRLDRDVPSGIRDAIRCCHLRLESQIQQLIDRFDDERWAFVLVRVEDICRKAKVLETGFYILPFCRKEVSDLVSGEISEKFEGSETEDNEFGQTLPVLSFSYQSNYRVFKDEISHFEGIGMLKGAIKCHGSFLYKGSGDGDYGECHILSEGVEQSLHDLLASAAAPSTNLEIVNSWTRIFGVAETLSDLEKMEYKFPNGKVVLSKGWHDYTDPNSIFWVEDRFKLADFNQSKFEVERSLHRLNVEKTHRAFLSGSPECTPGRRITQFTMKALHRMTIWSLGCVLSSFATWIVFGPDGYDKYQRLRSRAIRAMPTAQTDEGVSLHKCGFHDGFALLQSVKDWHQFLRLSLRLSDTITGKVLDLIETKLLVNHPKERISSRELVRVLEEIIVQAKHDYDTAIKNREMLPDEFFKDLQDLDIEKYGSTHVSESPDADSSDDEEAAHEARQSQSSRSACLDRSSVSGAKSPTDDEKD
ncbi:hypothetical protein QC762_608455 [Podospora pseudocomata]|uniref:Protein kinase domain-containing protein n=1 Tax=Podospora pseudocomata TaxID=2093779 RepID=A0ABR0G8P1_9PEZI|nr:hypothetical protein QC762_608455 [Podospora pseudocomata]